MADASPGAGMRSEPATTCRAVWMLKWLHASTNANSALGALQRGQLGHGDQTTRNVPTVVEGLAGKSVISGAIPHVV